MISVLSVTQINKQIEAMFFENSFLSMVRVSGEVSNCKYHSAGHIYFTIKDEGSQLSCVMFAGKRTGLSFRMQEGQKVIVSGNISVYARDGKYQLYANSIELEGAGRLHEEFLRMRSRLEAEGLFDPSHKKPIPRFAKRIGIITASDGAAIQDILNISKRRNPYVKLYLYPAKVQGDGAALTLIKGIKAMEKLNPDVIIIGRGGGSIEDLYEFNSEALARIIYDCPVPIVSAVGHETDFTICDFVSDLRAPTPSAAAELTVYKYDEVASLLVDYHSRLYSATESKLRDMRILTDNKKLRLSGLSPLRRLQSYRMRSASADDKLKNLMERALSDRKHKLAICAERLSGLSPLTKISMGYSYVTDKDGRNIKTTSAVRTGDMLKIQVTDGNILTRVEATERSEDDYG